MKRMVGKWCISVLLGLLMVFLVCSCSFAETAEVSWWNGSKVQTQQLPLQVNDKYIYAELPDGTISIVSYFGDEEVADIALDFSGKEVTSIQDYAFNFNNAYSSNQGFELNDTVYQYTAGYKLKQIILPDTVAYLGERWIVGVSWDHYIDYNIPRSLKYVGVGALDGLTIDEVPYFHNVVFAEGWQFQGIRSDVLTFAPEYKSIPANWCAWFSGKKIIIPDGVEAIEEYGLEMLSLNIEEIVLPQTLTQIGDYALTGRGVDKWTPELTITLPDALVHIGKNVLERTNIKDLTIPPNLKYIDETAFAECPLNTLTFAEGTISITTQAFMDCEQLITLNLPTTLTTIGERCFLRSGLTKLVIPANVTTIGEAAFKNSENLKDITLPASLTNIANDAFDGCASNAVFTVFTGTYAEQWANEHGFETNVLIPVTEINLNEEIVTLNKGKSLTLKATVGTEEATNKKVEWISTDPNVATVKNGKVQAKSCGSCEIICRAADGSGTQAVCQVTVIQMITSLQAKPQKLTIPYGEAGEVEVTLKPADATNQTLAWSSSDENVCVVDETGKIMSVGSGDCEIVCSTTDGSNKSAKIKVHVPIFDSTEASYTVTEKDGLLIPVDLHGASVADVTHKPSSDKYFLYYFDKEGLHIFPIAEGTATITLTSNLDKKDKMVYNVTVDKSAVYDTANGEVAPLNVIVTLDKSEAKIGENYTMKYQIVGGTAPYTIKEAEQQSWCPPNGGYAWRTNSIKGLAKASGSSKLATVGKGTFIEVVKVMVIDSLGEVAVGYSNRLSVEHLDVSLDEKILAAPMTEPLTINYSISGGSGLYEVTAEWVFEKVHEGTAVEVGKETETWQSGSSGSISRTPPQVDRVILTLSVTDKKNKKLLCDLTGNRITLTDGLYISFSTDKTEARVGDPIVATLRTNQEYPFDMNDTVYILKENIDNLHNSEVDQMKWKMSSPGIYVSEVITPECDLFSIGTVIPDDDIIHKQGIHVLPRLID